MQLHNYTTRDTMNFNAYHCTCHTGRCAYHMLQVGGREEILSMWFHVMGRSELLV